MTMPRFNTNGSEDTRALLAALLYVGDRAAGLVNVDWNLTSQESYLQKAQYLLESSYRNYPHPAQNLDQ